ncbi:hypothetical protein JFT37_19390 [Pseudomonas fluorescens]|nr:hypothetical protein [Pseudomonas fluorescens]
MSHLKARITALRELYEGVNDAETIFNKAALYSAIRFLIDDLCKDEGPDSYVREKAMKLILHAAAALGFDQDYGVLPARHLVHASIELNSMESALTRDSN